MLLLTRSSRHALLSLLICLGAALSFNAVPASAQANASGRSQIFSGVDIYGGWAYYNPLNSQVGGYKFPVIDNFNTTMSATVYLNRHFGVQVEGAYLSGGNPHSLYGPCSSSPDCNPSLYTGEAGLVYRYPLGAFTPFAHGLGGGIRMNGPASQPLSWGYGVTGGVGLDLDLPYFNHRFALRLFQADMQFNHTMDGAANATNTLGGTADVGAVKVSEGLVVHFGQQIATNTPLVFGCGAGPTTVYAGETVTVTGSTVGLPAKTKKPITYVWASKGGTVTPDGATATIDTTGLAPGQYDVVGKISVGNQSAFCSAPFNVQPFEPPTITCTATPSTVVSGTNSTIDCVGRSPQRRSLTYACTTSEGQISGTGQSETLSTAGLTAGTVTVTCKVTDDTGQTASTLTQVTVTEPKKPLAPKPESLCTLNFVRDVRRPTRVDNEAKGCLDDIALSLNLRSDSKLVLVGNGTATEKPEEAAARALNARQYLTTEKQIDPSRIEVRIGDTSGKTVKTYLVPAGASFDTTRTETFDEKAVVRKGQAYPGQHPAGKPHKRHKPAPKPATAPKPAATAPKP